MNLLVKNPSSIFGKYNTILELNLLFSVIHLKKRIIIFALNEKQTVFIAIVSTLELHR